LQKGVAWPNPRFTDNGNGSIKDNLTGLIWLSNASCFGRRTWSNALNDANTLNSGECGLSDSSVEGDWRLPNYKELFSLSNYGTVNTSDWLTSQGFSNVPTSYEYYWSSTSDSANSNLAFQVGVSGRTVIPDGKSDSWYVWPVRGGQSGTIRLPKTGQTTSYATGDDGDLQEGVAWPNPRFTVGTGTKDECVTDKLTGLMWAKNANPIGQKTWQEALDYIAAYPNSGGGMCGYTDWRLPNINELAVLFNSSMADMSVWLNIQGFSNVQNDSHYWSSTTNAGNPNGAGCVNINAGIVNGDGKTDPWGYVWPVRGGK
jgi:hypothetical protein